MGSTGLEGRGTHAEIDDEVMRSWRVDRVINGDDHYGYEVTFTDCRLIAFRSHWHVMRIDGQPHAIIHESIERSGGWWFYRSADEYMGPAAADCPLDLLALVPYQADADGPSGYGREWRERVRAHHASKPKLGTIKEGDRVQLGQNVTATLKGAWLTVTQKRGRTIICGRYRVPRTVIVAVERS